MISLSRKPTYKSANSDKHHKKNLSHSLNETKHYVSKVLFPEKHLVDLPLLFKRKIINSRLLLRKTQLTSTRKSKEQTLLDQIKRVPSYKTNTTKKTSSLVRSFDNIVSNKTGLRLLHETSQQETNNRGYYVKFFTYEMINAFISLLSEIIIVLHFEWTFNYNGNDDIYPYNFILIVLNILSVLLWINIMLYAYDRYKLNLLNRKYPKSYRFYQTALFKKAIVEVVCTFIQPSPLYSGMKYSIKPSFRSGISINRSINSVLSIFVLIRVYYIDRFLIFQSDYMTPDNNDVCRRHGFETNIKYSLIALLKTKPFHVYTIFVVTMLFVFQQGIKVFEIALSEHVEERPLNSFFHVLWYCLITIFTVGYGDYFARTDGGRILVTMLSLIGSFLISLFLMSMYNFLARSSTELKQFNLLKRIELIEIKNKRAQKVIGDIFEMYKDEDRNRNIRRDLNEMRPETRKFMGKIKSFENSEMEVEHHGDELNDYPFENVGFGIRYFDSEYQKAIEKDKKMISDMQEILAKLEMKNKERKERKERMKKEEGNRGNYGNAGKDEMEHMFNNDDVNDINDFNDDEIEKKDKNNSSSRIFTDEEEEEDNVDKDESEHTILNHSE